MNPVYSTAVGASITAFTLARWDVRVTGAEHVPATGGGVIATNHVGYLDFVFCGYGVRQQGRRQLRFVAKREVFDTPVAGPLMRSRGHVRVDRGGNTATAMREVAAALDRGDLVGLCPEGTISRSFVPLPGRPGAVRMAMAADVPLVPGAIWGSQRISTKGRKATAAPRTVVNVAFGPRITYRAGEDPVEVHGRLMASIRELVDELQRSYPQRPAGPSDTWWQPAHLGGSAPTVAEAEAMATADAQERRRRRSAGA